MNEQADKQPPHAESKPLAALGPIPPALRHNPVPSAPTEDVLRSPAALRTAELAAASGLWLFDYETRVELEWPETWLPEDRPDLGVDGLTPEWKRGVLVEPKYAAFRHDLLPGSVHAGQRAKWTAHELAHGLVGFAWTEDASALAMGLAARLAEVVPVALWYFWDEAWLARCPRHARQRVAGPGFCAACEEAARAGMKADDADAAWWLAEGMAFVEREVEATLASMNSGVPVFTPWAHIDLMSDGLAYASAHGPRLRSPEFQSWIARFAATWGERGGWFQRLEDLAARVRAVAQAIVSGAPLEPWCHAEAPDKLLAADIGWRLLQVGADTDGECYLELDRLIGVLAAAVAGPAEGVAAALAEVVAGYETLYEEYELPTPDAMFAVGRAIPGGVDRGFGLEQLRAGLETVCARTLELLGDESDAVVGAFARQSPSRVLLGRRFAGFLTGGGAGEAGLAVADVARLEAAIAHAAPPDTVELALGWDGADPEQLQLASGVELVESSRDTAAIVMHGAAVEDAKMGAFAWLVRRDAADQVGLTALSAGTAALIRGGFATDDGNLDAQTQYELNLLAEEAFVVPDRWELKLPHEARAPQH